MARKAKNPGTVNVQISPNPTGNEPENERQSSEADDINQALDALPEGSVAVLRRLEPNGDKAFIERTAPTAMDEARIATHGAGTYIIEFRGPLGDGTARVGYKGQRRVVIGESAARAASPAVASPVVASPNGTGGLVDQLAGGMLISMIQQMQQMSATQAQQSREHSTMMMTMLAKIAERPANDPLLMTLLPALLEKRADPIDQATRIAEIASKGGAKGDTSSVLAALELVEKIREMGGVDRGSNNPNWMGMVRDLAPLILKQNQQEVAAPMVANPATLPPNGDFVTEQPAALPNVTVPDDLKYLDPIAPYFSHVEISARNGTDPEVAAEFFLSFISAGLLPMFGSILDRPSIVPDIVKRAPALAPYEVWLGKLTKAMTEIIRESEGGEGDGDGG